MTTDSEPTPPVEIGAGEAIPGPPSTTPCANCQELQVRTLTTPVRLYHYCRSCFHSWNVANPTAR